MPLQVLTTSLFLVELDLLIFEFDLSLNLPDFTLRIGLIILELVLSFLHFLNLLLQGCNASFDDFCTLLGLSRQLVFHLHKFKLIFLPQRVLLTQEVASLVQNRAVIMRANL